MPQWRGHSPRERLKFGNKKKFFGGVLSDRQSQSLFVLPKIACDSGFQFIKRDRLDEHTEIGIFELPHLFIN